MADPAEHLPLDVAPEALEHPLGRSGIGGLQQRDEFLAAEAEQLVVEAQRVAHHLRHHDQHFVADQVAEVVIDPLEMIDVADGQPVAAVRTASPPPAFVGVGLAEQFEQVLVEGAPAGQAGQRVGFAVVEQSDVVAEIFDQAHQRDALLGREGHRQLQVDQVQQLVRSGNRKDEALCAAVQFGQHGRLRVGALPEQRVAVQAAAVAVFRQIGVAFEALSVAPEAGAGEGDDLAPARVAAVDGQLARGEQVDQGIEHRRIDLRAVAARRNPDDVTGQLEHGAGRARGKVRRL